MKTKVFSILFILASLHLYAQQRSNNPLSRYGYGELEDNNYALGDAINGAVTGLRDNAHINLGNSASLTALDSMSFIFEVGLSAKQYTFTQGEQSQDANNAGFDYLSFAFPIAKFWKTAGGVSAFSHSGYSFEVADLNSSPTNDIDVYTLSGEGGLSKVFWSNAFEPISGFSIGIDASYLFGEMRFNAVNSFENSNDDYSSVTRKMDTVFTNGFIFAGGMQYEHKFSDKKALSLGVVYRPAQKLTYRSTKRVIVGDDYYSPQQNYANDDVFEALQETGLSTDIAENLAFGLAFAKDEHYLVSADFEQTAWSDSEVYGLKNLNDYQRISLGGEWLPEKYSRHYFKRIKYRAGVRYENLQMTSTLNDGTNVDYTNMSVSFGLGLPFKQTRNSLNLMAEFGRHIASDDRALSNEYIYFKANMTLFEKWFFKRKID